MNRRRIRARLAGILVFLLLAFTGVGTALAGAALTGAPAAATTENGPAEPPTDLAPPEMEPPGELVPPPDAEPPAVEPPVEVAPPEVEPPVEVVPPVVEPPVEVAPPEVEPPVEVVPPAVEPPVEVAPPEPVPPAEVPPPDPPVAPAQVPEIEIDPAASSGTVGTLATWTITATVDGQPAMDASIEVRGMMDGQPDIVETGVVDSTGQFIHQHVRDVSGTETLQVTVTEGEETGTATGNFVWEEAPADPGVEIDLVPLDSSGPVGAPVTWTATVTADGEPLEEAFVYFSASMEGDEGTWLEEITDSNGVATFEHTRWVAGVDEITVETHAFEQEAWVETTFTWRQPLEVTLTTDGDSGEIGTPLTWSATVESDGEPVAGVEVWFIGHMEEQPDEEITLITDASGVATHTHTRQVAGTEMLQVVATLGEESVSTNTFFEWVEPVPVVEIDLVPLNSNGPVGVPVTWTATVTADGEPVEEAFVYFSTSMDGDEGIWLEEITDQDGVATFEHTQGETGVEEIVVETYVFEQETSVETTFTWREPMEVVLSAGDGSAETGTPLEWTASVTSDGEGVEGVSVRFLGQMQGQPDVDETVTTDSSGVATHTHTRQVGGTEQLTVAATYGEETVTATGSFVWQEPPPVVEIQLEPQDATGLIGDPVEWVATVTVDGEPLGETWVDFTATMEGAATVSLEGLTDDNGIARFEHTRSQPGEDTIWVGTVAFEQEAWVETTFVWEEPVPVVTLTQSSASGEVGTPLTWTATVTRGDDGMAGVPVRFLGQLTGQPDVDVTVTTDASGVATHTHSRAVAGTESLLVAADVGEETLVATGSFVWEEPAPPVVQIDLAPGDASGPVGETVEWVATVTADGAPQPGVSVTFGASMPGVADVTLEGTTGPDGTAAFEHTRSTAGVDTITVESVVLDQEVSAATTFAWQQPTPPVLQVGLTPASSSGGVGSTATWTATVTLDGTPVSGATVEFRGVIGGAADIVEPAVPTSGSGQAVHTHTRQVAGVETVTATASLGELTATAAATRTWMTTPATPPVPPTPPPPATPPVTPLTPAPTTPPATTSPATPPATTPPAVVPPLADIPSVGDLEEIINDPGTGDEDPVAAPPAEPVQPAPVPPTAPTPTSQQTPASQPLTDVTLGSSSATPGGDLEVSGAGCEPGSTVQILLGGQPMATTTADASGAFTVRAAVSSMPLGQYAVEVECDGRTGEAQVDLVSTIASSTAPAAAASAAAVLTFFVMLGAGVIKGSVGSAG